jgi:hypothetical protein
MNKLRIRKEDPFYYFVYAPEDGDGSCDYSWYVSVVRNDIHPSDFKWVDYWDFVLDIPMDCRDDVFKEWLEMAYALGELPVGKERMSA